MARLVGVDLPRDKRVEIGLTYIYGIGLTTSKRSSPKPAWIPTSTSRTSREDDLTKLRDYIQENIKVEGDLHREVSQNVKRPHGDRLLSWPAPSSRPARSRTAHAHERAYPQGSS